MVSNVEPLVDLKVQINIFSMRWVLSGVPDTGTVGFQTASYPSLSCAGNYLKLSRDQRGVPSVPILYFPHFISGRQLIFYSCFDSDQTSDFPPNNQDFNETGIGTAFQAKGGEGLAAHLNSEI